MWDEPALFDAGVFALAIGIAFYVAGRELWLRFGWGSPPLREDEHQPLGYAEPSRHYLQVYRGPDGAVFRRDLIEHAHHWDLEDSEDWADDLIAGPDDEPPLREPLPETITRMLAEQARWHGRPPEPQSPFGKESD